MPTYEYQCTQCGHRFESFQNMSDIPLEACPSCGGKVKRLISAGSGFIIKNSGGSRPACGNERPCCGRSEPCGKSHGCG